MILELSTIALLFASSVTNARRDMRINPRGKGRSDHYDAQKILVLFYHDCFNSTSAVQERIDELTDELDCIFYRSHSPIVDLGDSWLVFFDATNKKGSFDCLEDTDITDDCIEAVEYSPMFAMDTESCVSQSVLSDDMPWLYAWNLDDSDSDPDNGYYTHYQNTDDTGVDIYILDTGVLDTHDEFIDNEMVNLSPDFTSILDDHGTHVAGIAAGKYYGISKGMNVYSYTVCRDVDSNDDLWCSFYDIMDGFEAVYNQLSSNGRKGVINFSIGGSYSDYIATVYDRELQKILDVDGIFTIAAGNSGADACETAPAYSQLAVTVGALHYSANEAASFSNYGSCVDIWAPGVSVRAAIDSSDTSYGSKSGTSMAAPHICGHIANIWAQNSDFSLADMLEYLQDSSVDVDGCDTSCDNCEDSCHRYVNNCYVPPTDGTDGEITTAPPQSEKETTTSQPETTEMTASQPDTTEMTTSAPEITTEEPTTTDNCCPYTSRRYRRWCRRNDYDIC